MPQLSYISFAMPKRLGHLRKEKLSDLPPNYTALSYSIFKLIRLNLKMNDHQRFQDEEESKAD